MRGLLTRKPVQSVTLDTAIGSITTSAWKELSSALSAACSGLEIFNGSGSSIQIATGAAGSEVALPYTVLPGGTTGMISAEISKGVRLSAKAIDVTMSTGYFIVNLFG